MKAELMMDKMRTVAANEQNLGEWQNAFERLEEVCYEKGKTLHSLGYPAKNA